MADIEALARSALRKLDNGDALQMPDAIRKAIRGSGISGESNERPLMKKVGTVIGRWEREAKQAKRRSQAHGR